jgi:methionine-rich copper-binding protein CopC
MRKIAKTALTILVSSLISGWAYAHPALEGSNPGQGATVPAPKEIRLTFSEKVIPKFSGLTIKDKGGALIEAAVPSTDPKTSDNLSFRSSSRCHLEPTTSNGMRSPSIRIR